MPETVLDLLNQALHAAFQHDGRVYLLGEDVLDPYGGAFKVTRGLSSKYPGRVISTPISEAGIVGVATGMALRGLHPVVEIMFGDFITLAADQLINHAAKFRWMYNDQVRVPLTIRTPMGGRRGYGPTHSQTLEKLFLGVPGLQVMAPSPFEHSGLHAGCLLEHLILNSENPTLFIENKLLYLLPVQRSSTDIAISLLEDNPESPVYLLQIQGAPSADVTIAAYGYMAELARQAMLKLAYEHEIFVEVVTPTRLSPFQAGPVLARAQRSRRLLTVEEGSLSMGWGAEVLARCVETLGSGLQRAGRVAAAETPIPASGVLEAEALPGVKEIIHAVLEMTA